MLPLAAVTALASLVYGASGVRRPRMTTTTAIAVTGIALALVPILFAAFVAYEIATGGIE